MSKRSPLLIGNRTVLFRNKFYWRYLRFHFEYSSVPHVRRTQNWETSCLVKTISAVKTTDLHIWEGL